jgi:hypothetical protein
VDLKILHKMTENFFSKIFKEKKNNDIDISFFSPFCLEINTKQILDAKVIGDILYSFHDELNYLFNVLDYQVKIQKKVLKVE